MVSSIPARKLLLTGCGLAMVITTSLLFGWWQIDGPGAPETNAPESKLPLPMAVSDQIGLRPPGSVFSICG